jgi:peptidyl-prolyl cis-trans isomerase C
MVLGLLLNIAYAEEADPIFGKVGDYVIKKSDLDRLISFYPPERQKQILNNPQQKLSILKKALESIVITERAKKEGFDKNADTQEKLRYIINDYLSQEYLRKVVTKDIRVTEEDLKNYWAKNEKNFSTPAQVRARHILIKVAPNAAEEEKKKAKEKATELLKKVKEGADFAKLAGEASEDAASKQKGGDLGYFAKGKMVKPFDAAVFSVKPGQLSDIVETQFGFHIIKVEDYREAKARSFDEVKENLKPVVQNEMVRLKTEEFTKKASQEAGMELYPEKVLRQKK